MTARGGGGQRFCYISLRLFRVGGGYFTKQLRDGRHKILELKEYFLGSLVHYKIMRMKLMDQFSPVHIAKDELLV